MKNNVEYAKVTFVNLTPRAKYSSSNRIGRQIELVRTLEILKGKDDLIDHTKC